MATKMLKSQSTKLLVHDTRERNEFVLEVYLYELNQKNGEIRE